MNKLDGNGLVVWWIGKLGLVFWVLCCIGAVIYWLKVNRRGTLFQLKSWTNEQVNRLILTYLHLVFSYIMSTLSVMYISSAPKLLEYVCAYPYEVALGVIGALSLLTTALEFTPYCPENNLVKNFTWLLHSLVIGFPLSYFGPFICSLAMLSTVFALVLATVVSFLAEDDFYKSYEGKIIKLYYAVLISSVICLLLDKFVTFFSAVMLTVNIFGGTLLYFSVFIVNTQYIFSEVKTSEAYDPIYTSAVLYLCTMNLFVRIALYHLIEHDCS